MAKGGVLVRGDSGVIVQTAAGSSGEVLTSNGAGAVPTFQSPAASGITQLTGDVTAGPGSGSQAATIAANAVTTAKILDANVTLAKMANIATDSILGRATAAVGVAEVLTALPFAFTGDVTRAADSNAQTIANDAVTYAKMQNVSAASRLLGRGSASGAGDVEEVTLGAGLALTGTVLDVTGTGGVTTGVTLTNNQIVVGAGSAAIKVSNLTGDVTTSGGVATTIANDAVTTAKILAANVTLAKIANAAANSKLLGSGAAGSGASYAELTLGTNLSMSGTTLNATGSGGNITGTTAFGSEPGSPASGDLDFYTNSFYVSRYSGAAWVPWGPLFPLVDPTIAGPTTWVNQGSSTVDTTLGGIYLETPGTAGTNMVLRVKTSPSTPYTITAALLFNNVTTSNRCGLTFRQSSDGKLHVLSMQADGGGRLYSAKWNTATSFSANYTGFPIEYPWCGPVFFLRIADNGTNRILSVSADGQHFIAVQTVGRTDFMTADQVGFWVSSASASFGAGVTLLSWVQA